MCYPGMAVPLKRPGTITNDFFVVHPGDDPLRGLGRFRCGEAGGGRVFVSFLGLLLGNLFVVRYRFFETQLKYWGHALRSFISKVSYYGMAQCYFLTYGSSS